MSEEQLDLFIADIVDVSGRSDLETMEFPLFTISKTKDLSTYRYEDPNRDIWIEVVPSVDGRANIFDKDLLIYCLGQLTEARNRGRSITRRIQLIPRDFMVSTGRSTGGKDYNRLHESLARLRGTTIRTNLGEGTTQRGEVFGLIDDANIVAENGRTIGLELTISERLFKALSNGRVLAYNEAYFDLKSPLHRRLYELCRKHCGQQPLWEIGLEKLHNKVGSNSSLREFKRVLGRAERDQPIPNYIVGLDEKRRRDTKFYAMYDQRDRVRNHNAAEHLSAH
ncbi:MAG: replication initiator protein A [Pseudomonadota bacterium]